MSFTVYIGLGSNLANRAQNIETAINNLTDNDSIKINRVSTIIETEPYGFTEQSKFLNCVLEVETNLTPQKLLEITQAIERDMGRVKTLRWGPRIIDLDLLFYADLVYSDNSLTIPHPEIHKRWFILESLKELSPELVHPIFNKTIAELHAKISMKAHSTN